MSFDFGQIAAGFQNIAASVTNSPLGTAIGSALTEVTTVAVAKSLINNGNLPTTPDYNPQNAISKVRDGEDLTIGDSVGFLGSMITGAFRNKDGSPKGIDGGILNILDSTLKNVDPAGDVFNYLLGTSSDRQNAVKDALSKWSLKDSSLASALSNIAEGDLDGFLKDLADGDLLTGGRTGIDRLLVGAFGGTAQSYAPWAVDKNFAFGIIPAVIDELGRLLHETADESADYTPWNPATFAVPSEPDHPGNVGHGAHTEVWLGGLRFEIPPAVGTSLPVHGSMPGRGVPGAQGGISMRHMQNYATLLIPGSAPVYQSLGISGHAVEFVGMFLGFDHGKHLNPELHSPGYYDKDNPDPLGVGLQTKYDWTTSMIGGKRKDGTTKEGGSWAVSREFQYKIQQGEPLEFVILSGSGVTTYNDGEVSLSASPIIRIKYKLIVTSFERLYERDDRTYYKVQGLALGGSEWKHGPQAGNTGGGASKKPQAATGKKPPSKTKRTNKAADKNTAGAKSTTPKSSSSIKKAELVVRRAETIRDRIFKTFQSKEKTIKDLNYLSKAIDQATTEIGLTRATIATYKDPIKTSLEKECNKLSERVEKLRLDYKIWENGKTIPDVKSVTAKVSESEVQAVKYKLDGIEIKVEELIQTFYLSHSSHDKNMVAASVLKIDALSEEIENLIEKLTTNADGLYANPNAPEARKYRDVMKKHSELQTMLSKVRRIKNSVLKVLSPFGY